MRVLVVGSGGREAALVWALHTSPSIDRLCCAPGSAGIARLAERVAISVDDIDGLVEHAVAERYDLVVVGPEAPLCAGLSDRLRSHGIDVFGPSAAAAELEGSKAFSKEFMARHDIPTAGFKVFTEADAALAYLRDPATRYPLVVKADGLAAGKGVILADTADEACAAAADMLDGGAFGDAGRRVVIEDRLVGREVSFFVLSDGSRYVELATCQDYKRALDGDAGNNTGGMGCYSPSVYLDAETRRTIREKVIEPTIRGMAEEGRAYRGVLYTGLMLTEQGPQVLEYNARFGDPETQVLMPRLDGDWLPLLQACARGSLEGVEPRWKKEAAVCVVMSAGGYPGSYEKGTAIEGLNDAEGQPGVIVYHAGTDGGDEQGWRTAGGRVLGVTALGATLSDARDRAYAAVDRIRWDAEHHRTDIALDAIKRDA